MQLGCMAIWPCNIPAWVPVKLWSNMVEKFLPDAEHFGDIYRTVLAAGTITAKEIAKILKIPDAEVEASLQQLERLGVVSESTSITGAFRAVSAQMAFTRTVESLISNLGQQIRDVNEIARVITETRDAGITSSEQSPSIQIIVGSDNVTACLEAITNAAVRSVDSLVPELPEPRSLKLAFSGDSDLAKRSLRLRAIYPEAARFEPSIRNYIRSIGGSATEIRTNSVAPVRLVIADSKVALIRFGKPNSFQRGIVIRQPDIVVALDELYEALWVQSTVLDVTNTSNDLSNRQIAILNSLMLRASDEAIARDLGLSVRTVRRDISEMYQLANTQTRFGLGVQAHLRGWL